jgi:predicted RNA binding protein YcfA (HicA-like mRNA interferase family)
MSTDEDCRAVIELLKKNKKNRTPEELAAILVRFGFKEHKRNRGSHRPFSKPGCAVSAGIPDGGRKGVLVPYVNGVIRALEEGCDE